jgi:two-component system LytT family response regulator
MKIRTLIVDDEPLARDRLQKLLRAQPTIELIGECSDGEQALAEIQELKPDLVFLDVQMPELDGFAVLEALPAASRPTVIFVTAHDRFALKAFEVHAVDYLLKPFDRERFQVALDRALKRIQHSDTDDLKRRLNELLSDLKPEPTPLDRLAVKKEGRTLLVKTSDVEWIEAADNYVVLHVGAEAHMLRETMASLEERLAGNKFVRISRSSLVNTEQIKELQPMFHGEYRVLLKNGTRLTLSRTHRAKLDWLLGKSSTA